MKTLIGWLDDNVERVLILIAYASMALIIVFAVFERFVLKTQIPWSTSIPIYLFLWVTWIGCSDAWRGSDRDPRSFATCVGSRGPSLPGSFSCAGSPVTSMPRWPARPPTCSARGTSSRSSWRLC